jgi:hypothetical protein
MVTAFGREEALDEAERQGVALKSVLTKPVMPSQLLDAIGAAIDRKGLVENRTGIMAHESRNAMRQLEGARVLLVEDNELNQSWPRSSCVTPGCRSPWPPMGWRRWKRFRRVVQTLTASSWIARCL